MNKESNTYTILYATIMVVIVAVALAFTSQALRKPQKANEQIDKMQQILRSVKIDAKNKKEVPNIYKKTITKEMLVSAKTGDVLETFEGDKIAQNDVFEMNVKNEMKLVDSNESDKLPLFQAVVNDSTLYIIPLTGTGLWGDIWGYISVDKNYKVHGADFSHAGETPGLGAEIATTKFGNEFLGKDVKAKDGNLGIAVVKKNHTDPNYSYVDGISGGTLTSNGVDAMLKNCINKYKAFLQKQSANQTPADTQNAAEETK